MTHFMFHTVYLPSESIVFLCSSFPSIPLMLQVALMELAAKKVDSFLPTLFNALKGMIILIISLFIPALLLLEMSVGTSVEAFELMPESLLVLPIPLIVPAGTSSFITERLALILVLKIKKSKRVEKRFPN